MSEISFFDEVAAVGGEILTSVGGRNDVAPFLRRTRDVYQLLVEIHDDIVNATVEVGTARTLDEARRVLRSLHHDALEPVFRARRWCDEMEALGQDLHTLPAGVYIDGTRTWDEFTVRLQQREGEVARLYEEAMYRVISRAESATSLTQLQDYIDGVSAELVLQKATFDLLAKRAAAIARRR
jgi:hypothetical protein